MTFPDLWVLALEDVREVSCLRGSLSSRSLGWEQEGCDGYDGDDISSSLLHVLVELRSGGPKHCGVLGFLPRLVTLTRWR